MDRAEIWEVFVVEVTGLMCSGPKTVITEARIYVCVCVCIESLSLC